MLSADGHAVEVFERAPTPGPVGAGFLLQPESMEGDTILKTSLPRVSRADFPPGRGFFIARGKSMRVQLPLVE